MIRRFAVLLVAAALCLPSACTSSTKKNDGRPTGSAKPSTSRAAPTIVQPSSVPVNPPNKKGVLAKGLVSLTSCASTHGGWQAKGIARGEKGKAASYTITIFFTTSQATVQAFGATKVKVTAGRTKAWTVTKSFKAVPNTRCVIRGAG